MVGTMTENDFIMTVIQSIENSKLIIMIDRFRIQS